MKNRELLKLKLNPDTLHLAASNSQSFANSVECRSNFGLAINPRNFSIVLDFRRILTEAWQLFLTRLDLLPSELHPILPFIPLLQHCFAFCVFISFSWRMSIFGLQFIISARTVCLEVLQQTLKGTVGCFAIPPRQAWPCRSPTPWVSPWLSCPRYCRTLLPLKPSLLTSPAAPAGRVTGSHHWTWVVSLWKS